MYDPQDPKGLLEPCGYGNLWPDGSTTTPLYRSKTGKPLKKGQCEELKACGWTTVMLRREDTSTGAYGRFWVYRSK